MAKPSERDIVERFVGALGKDPDLVAGLVHPDYIEEWPQSGERVRGWDNLQQILASYPGADDAVIGTVEVRGVAGGESEWVMTPSLTILQIVGTGDVYTAESRGRYPDGSEWFVIHIIKLKDDKVHRVTTYFAESFEAPDWRAPFVERME